MHHQYCFVNYTLLDFGNKCNICYAFQQEQKAWRNHIYTHNPHDSSFSWSWFHWCSSYYECKTRCPNKPFQHYLFMNEYYPTALICPWALGNVLIYLLSSIWDSLLPCQISKSSALSCGFISVFLHPLQYRESKKKLYLLVRAIWCTVEWRFVAHCNKHKRRFIAHVC